jgi:hypothetical protein
VRYEISSPGKLALGLNRGGTIPITFFSTRWENVHLVAWGHDLAEEVLSSMDTLCDGGIDALDVGAVEKLLSLLTHLLNF